MNVNDLQKYLISENNITEMPEIFKQTLLGMVDKKAKTEKALENPFQHLYADLIERPLNYSFEKSLKENEYKLANKHSKSCIQISVCKIDIPVENLVGWIIDALSAFDIPIINYIQVIRKELIPDALDKYGRKLSIERAGYQYLQKTNIKDENYVGINFDALYRVRNGLHTKVRNKSTQIIDIIEPPSDHKAKQDIMKFMKQGLLPLLRLYKTNLPN